MKKKRFLFCSLDTVKTHTKYCFPLSIRIIKTKTVIINLNRDLLKHNKCKTIFGCYNHVKFFYEASETKSSVKKMEFKAKALQRNKSISFARIFGTKIIKMLKYKRVFLSYDRNHTAIL